MIELYYQKSEDGGAYNPRENTDIFFNENEFWSVSFSFGETW